MTPVNKQSKKFEFRQSEYEAPINQEIQNRTPNIKSKMDKMKDEIQGSVNEQVRGLKNAVE